MIMSFREYITHQGRAIRTEDFISNVESKMKDQEFRKDILGLLRLDKTYDPDIAFQWIRPEILEKL